MRNALIPAQASSIGDTVNKPSQVAPSRFSVEVRISGMFGDAAGVISNGLEIAFSEGTRFSVRYNFLHENYHAAHRN
jgi:hypothetical protein